MRRSLFLGNFLFGILLLIACGGNDAAPPATRDTAPPTDRSGAPSSPQPGADDRPVIVAFGDSLSAGYHLPPSESYPAQLERRLQQLGYRYRVINAGVSGETSAQGASRVSVVIGLRPEIVIVEFGANDGLRGVPVEATRRNLVAIVSSLRQSGSEVVLAGMLLPSNYGAVYQESFRKMFAEVARSQDVTLIPFFLLGVAGRDDLNLDDGIHPNAAGYRIVAETVLGGIRPLLKKQWPVASGQ